jgi:hypothetical protein
MADTTAVRGPVQDHLLTLRNAVPATVRFPTENSWALCPQWVGFASSRWTEAVGGLLNSVIWHGAAGSEGTAVGRGVASRTTADGGRRHSIAADQCPCPV